ncbi:hypothetical protein J6590_020961 [Homalodisca vitripennis]|nr:hypothetical protein J6590_020961 [Homalodisca vitripennis]
MTECVLWQMQVPKDKEAHEVEWQQYITGVAACLSLVASGAWFSWPAPLLPRLVGPDSPVPMTPEEVSWVVSSVEVGCLFSPFPSTFLADHYGRKLSMLFATPLFFIGLCLTIYIKTFWSLCLARFVAGFSMGIPWTILPLYLGEIATPKSRGAITSFFHVAWGLGCLFPYCVGPFLPFDMFTYVTFSLSVIFLICFAWQPESPYYYVMRGKPKEASKMLKILRGSHAPDLLQKELEEIQLEVKKSLEEKASWIDIFTNPADRKALLLIIIVGMVSFLSGQNAILTYATDTFSKFSNNFIAPDFITIAVGVVALLGSVFSVFTSDRFGRRFLLLISSIGCMISLVIASAYFYLDSNTSVDVSSYSWVAPVAIMSYNLFVTAGMHPVCVTYTSELFLTSTRGVASSISGINLTFCSFLVLKFYEPISAAMGIYFAYLCYALTCLIGMVLFYYMMPETKKKTFLEIRESLKR